MHPSYLLKSVTSFLGKEEVVLLGRWCTLSSNPKCDPHLKAYFANCDNGYETMKAGKMEEDVEIGKDPVSVFFVD